MLKSHQQLEHQFHLTELLLKHATISATIEATQAPTSLATSTTSISTTGAPVSVASPSTRTPAIITNFEPKPEIPRIISINNKKMIVFTLYRLLFRKAWRTGLPFRRASRRNFARVALKKVPAQLSSIAPAPALKSLTNNVPLNYSSVS